MGRNHGQFTLKKILAFDLLKNSVVGEYAFDATDSSFDKDISVSLSQLIDKYEREYAEISLVSVTLVTPLRMKRLGSENWHLYFRTLIRSVLVRMANLAYSYCGFEEFPEFPETLYRAGRIRIVKENFVWEDWRPPNRRQDDSVRLGGFLGEIIYQGDITEFWPILRLGEVLHIGKNTSFGLGRILVEPDEATSKTR
ncbi:MAG TPA: CRISPR system precrRNA processing endoribonuclease RAMP protein Cas6 [Bacteroidetes bacterium]|nr:CRISPR system precrRNA processing endoribonuclease RAMP protein Cas6 [Bacteroidota bacterium]